MVRAGTGPAASPHGRDGTETDTPPPSELGPGQEAQMPVGLPPPPGMPPGLRATPREGVLGAGAPPGRGEETGRHRREGGGRWGVGQALETPSPLTLSRTTRSCCGSVAEPTEGPWSIPAHPRPTQHPFPPPQGAARPCLSHTRGDRFWSFQLDPQWVSAQETASEWVPREVTETASLTPRLPPTPLSKHTRAANH